ncbi:MAG: hypothetical protein LBH35_03560 [Treponema sp.]|jgi:hypothetical protein|nr:hypothetical protein [Treponema sp.]
MELLVLEICAAVFLFLPVIRPVFKALWNLDGLVLLPVLSLGILIGIFPVYGFRPECVPLLVFAVFTNLTNLNAVISLFSHLHNDDYRDRGLLYTAVNLAVFGFVLWIALYYSPPFDMAPYEKARTMLLQDRGRNEELWLRIYAPEPDLSSQALRPLLLLVPPVAGSVTVTDAVCAGLVEKGFTVLSYSRPGFDSPAVSESGVYRRLPFSRLFRLGNALCRGLTDAAANAAGRELEEGREKDVEFLLAELSWNKTLRDGLSGADKNCVFLAGYGAGGAALVSFAAAPDFAARFSQVKGIIALESPLYSSIDCDPPPPSPPPTENPLIAFFRETGVFFRNLVPRKVNGVGAVPEPEIPLMFVVSDRVRERGGRYETILKTLNSARGPVLVASLSGAGPFDYSDSPRLYPIYSFLFRGGETGRAKEEYPGITAALMANFAAFVMESGENSTELFGDSVEDAAEGAGENVVRNLVDNTGENAAGIPEIYLTAPPPEKTALFGMNLETGGVWNLPDSRFILQP